MDYILRIKLMSSLTSSAGEGRVGWVDRDIVFNDLGLPILPGRRIKGLWREAYCDVYDAWNYCKQSLISVETIFGKTGSAPKTTDIGLHVADAILDEDANLEAWLNYLQDPKEPKLFQEDVVQHYANARKQTSINRLTGAADENTFRLSRTLHPDYVFKARVSFEKQPKDEIIRILAVSAAALQYMGTSRTRGLGHVKCALLSPKDANNKRQNLTKQVLEELKDAQNNNKKLLPSIVLNCTSENNQNLGRVEDSDVNEDDNVEDTVERSENTENGTNSVGSSNCDDSMHLLRYRLTLKEPVVIPATAGDPNTVVGRHEISGSNVWGAAARIYLNQDNKLAQDAEFRHVFLQDGLKFLSAYPESFDNGKRMIPIPHSIRELKKDKGRVMDFSGDSGGFGDEPIKRLGQRYGDISQYDLKTQAVKTQRNSHHARVTDNRRIGRALGAEDGGGSIFQYEAIQAGQTFQGAILGPELQLRNLQKWLKDGTILRIGRSLSAQYGLVEFHWIDTDKPKKYNDLVEWDGFLTASPASRIPTPGKRLIITTLSSLLTVNSDGHPDMSFPKHELAKVLCMNSDDLTLKKSYTRTEMIGGYQTHLRLPRQQFPAIASGSVFEFECPRELNENDSNVLNKLEQEGLGLRKGQGFGRIAVNRQVDLSFREETQLDDIENQDSRVVPAKEVPDKLQVILEEIVLKRFIVKTKILAYEAAERIVEQIPKNNIPSNTLIGRLRLILQRGDFNNRSDEFFKIAEEKLTKHPVNISKLELPELDSTLDLSSLFKGLWEKRETIVKKLLDENTLDFIGSLHRNLIQIEKLVENESERICIIFFTTLLTALHRES